MKSGIKDVGLGLVIGMCATALVGMAGLLSLGKPQAVLGLVAFASPTEAATSTASPIPSATLTPSVTPIPPTATETPLPSPTATLEPVQALINSGGLVFAGALSNDHQIALYKASLNYIGPDAANSARISKQINGVGYGDPTNICGPLAIAILKDAGLMTPAIIPHDFWLLNPLAATDQVLLKRAFPSTQYVYSKTLTPINKMNWRVTPLLPGDFLFIWHGSGGNFDHMLVVTRLDSNLRAYAVTNYGTADGYVINEALLYDPSDPSVGLFHLWTQEQDAILGSTGFGGFELWRRTAP